MRGTTVHLVSQVRDAERFCLHSKSRSACRENSSEPNPDAFVSSAEACVSLRGNVHTSLCAIRLLSFGGISLGHVPAVPSAQGVRDVRVKVV